MYTFQIMFRSDIDAVTADGRSMKEMDDDMTDVVNSCIDDCGSMFIIAVNQCLHDSFDTPCTVTYLNIEFYHDTVEIFVEGESVAVESVLRSMLKKSIEDTLVSYQSFNEFWDSQCSMYINLDLK